MIMDPDTLQWATGLKSLGIAVEQVLSTPKNHGIFNRGFGNNLLDKIDTKLTPNTTAEIGSEILEQLEQIEGLHISRIDFRLHNGQLNAKITGVFGGKEIEKNKRIY